MGLYLAFFLTRPAQNPAQVTWARPAQNHLGQWLRIRLVSKIHSRGTTKCTYEDFPFTLNFIRGQTLCHEYFAASQRPPPSSPVLQSLVTTATISQEVERDCRPLAASSASQGRPSRTTRNVARSLKTEGQHQETSHILFQLIRQTRQTLARIPSSWPAFRSHGGEPSMLLAQDVLARLAAARTTAAPQRNADVAIWSRPLVAADKSGDSA